MERITQACVALRESLPGAEEEALGEKGAAYDDGLLSLPVEVWYHIFGLLQPRDALPIVLVCRSWHDIVFSGGSWVWASWYRQRFPESRAKPRTPSRWKNLYLLRLREEKIKEQEKEAERKESLDAYPIRRRSSSSYVE